MKFATWFFLVFSFLPAICGEREDRYFQEHCLPLVRDFIRRSNLSYDPGFPTNSISHRRVEYFPESRVYASRMMIEKRYAFMFLGKEGTNGISWFSNKTSPWTPSLMNPEHEQKMRTLAARTNLLDHTTALALAQSFFRRLGHDEKNFKTVKFEQAIWAADVPSRRIVLPFYEAEWLRTDAKEPDRTLQPSVSIAVSGLESNLVSYSRISMPYGYGQDWEVNGQTNRAQGK